MADTSGEPPNPDNGTARAPKGRARVKEGAAPDTSKPEGAERGDPGLNPWQVLQEARKTVPFLDYAVGVVGLAAAAAIVIFFLGYSRAAVFSITAVLIGSILLFAISRLALSRSKASQFAGIVVLWAVIAFFVTFLGFTISAVAAGQPCNWAEILGITPSCAKATEVACASDPAGDTSDTKPTLAVTPVYPPREGVQVGDVYAVEEHDAADRLTAKTAFIDSIDMSAPIRAYQKSRYQYVSGEKPVAGVVAEMIDNFPAIEVDSGVALKVSDTGKGSDPKRLRLTARFSDVTSTEVPVLVGARTLSLYCDNAVTAINCRRSSDAYVINLKYNSAQSDPGYVRSAGVLFLTKVYRAKSITYSALCASAASAMGVTAVATGGSPIDLPSQVLETQDPALIDAMTDLRKALQNAPTTDSQSVLSSLKALPDNSVMQTFARPVVIGYESVSIAGIPDEGPVLLEPDASDSQPSSSE